MSGGGTDSRIMETRRWIRGYELRDRRMSAHPGNIWGRPRLRGTSEEERGIATVKTLRMWYCDVPILSLPRVRHKASLFPLALLGNQRVMFQHVSLPRLHTFFFFFEASVLSVESTCASVVQALVG